MSEDEEAAMSDAAVLSINSPNGQVRGPYMIAYKDTVGLKLKSEGK